MLGRPLPNARLAPRAGVGLKPRHYDAILSTEPDIGWFEIHAENYMGAGGPPHTYLQRIRQDYPLSVHGVGLSIGGAERLDRAHLARLKTVIDRYQPALVSEHLAWSTHQGCYFNDLLALPYTTETLALVCDHIDEAQTYLGRQILLENPSSYLCFHDSTLDEVDFIAELAQRTGCGLLLDINNVYVSSANHSLDPTDYIDRFPTSNVAEIHLAGHATDAVANDDGRPLLIDAHDRPVADPVWTLYAHALTQCGPVASLIEWDNDIPDWPDLLAEAQRAEGYLTAATDRKAERDVA